MRLDEGWGYFTGLTFSGRLFTNRLKIKVYEYFQNFKFSLLLSLGPALLTALVRHQYFFCTKSSLPLRVCVEYCVYMC